MSDWGLEWVRRIDSLEAMVLRVNCGRKRLARGERMISMNIIRNLHCVLVLTCILSACDSEDDETSTPTATPPTFQFVDARVLTLSCDFSGCHAGSSASAGLDLTVEDRYSRIVNVASVERPELLLIKPGSSAESYLVQKLLGLEGIEGDKMPPDGAIEEEYLRAMIDWVDAGALNN